MDEEEYLRVIKDADARREEAKQEEARRQADVREKKARVRATPTVSYGDRLLADAAAKTTLWAANDGLHPTTDPETGDFRYDVQQGLRAACVGREDAASTLILMPTILNNQQTIKRLLWVAVILLAYIALKLHAI